MGCDIHMYCESFSGKLKVFKMTKALNLNRNYSLFGWLADVRNYSMIKPLAEPRGIPNDVSKKVKVDYDYYNFDAHSASYFTIAELLAVDYKQIVEDRRCTIDGNGGSTCEEGKGEKMTLEKFIGKEFVDTVARLHYEKVDRIVFWFDN